ncbi:hypothetical protein Riv7116_0013 [Rivularia sp. PCC 7116]|uniref:DUF952 domain-containing protein n=1 Tax=Rivularia sp. PCC 7116 TaxID=373994 RepID=UPI00029ECDFE|nr:DUF952 domain-containing protein [Rivularia sp. PCC 7116]AFY52629.1 hypothetical protein Riv7116_0013 [Rivularia sp. PCC 7116]
MKTIYHITPRQDWEQAKAIGVYRAQSLETEGFIHCSTSAQVVKVANSFFKNQTDLLLLFINPDEVESEIRYDLVLGKERFPHIYGALNLNAIFKAINFEANQNGLFELPSLDLSE